MPCGFFWRGWTCSLSSCFCGSFPPTSAYSITFPLLQGVMWITVGRKKELWKTCSNWISPCREWDHCDADCRTQYLSLVRLMLCQFMLLEIVQVSSLWVEKGRATADTALCHLTVHSMTFRTWMRTKEPHPRWGMICIIQLVWRQSGLIYKSEPLLMTYWWLCLHFLYFLAVHPWQNRKKCSIENGLICNPI